VDKTTAKVQSRLEFILRHFSNPLFPRKVSTAATENKQKPVQNITDAMNCFQEGSWLDSRIAAFGIEQTNPDLIFIDLDTENFASLRSFKLALATTLKNIKNKLGGFPTVYWSGRGYHIILPIDCPVNLENVKEFVALTDNNNPNNKFLRFVERYLSSNKHDKGNYPAMRSCMLRVPGSLNSKCKAAGVDAEVKIIQKWDGHRPDYRLLIGSFYADLVGQRFPSVPNKKRSSSNILKNYRIVVVPWIEKLLQTPIEDYRKHARDLIIIPYLVVNRGLTDKDQIAGIVMHWADKCAELKRLDPSKREFAHRVRSRTYEVMQQRVPPMKLDTLKDKNPELYQNLKLSGEV